MDLQCVQIIFLLVQIIALSATFAKSVPKLESLHLLSTRKYNPKKQFNIFIKDSPEKESNKISKNDQYSQYFHTGFNVIPSESSGEIKNYFSKSIHYTKKHFSQKLLSKRSLSIAQNSEENQEIDRNLSTVEMPYDRKSLNNFTELIINFSTEQTTITDSNKTKSNYSTSLVTDNSRSIITENPQEVSLSSSVPNKTFRWLYIDLTNKSNINITTFRTSDFPIKGNDSKYNFEILPENISSSDLCNNLCDDNGILLPSVVSDLRNHFSVFNANETDFTIPEVTLNDLRNFSDEILYNLTRNFNCVVNDSDILIISCRNVFNLYSVSEYLPNDTVVLDISYSTQVKMLKPLLPHLKNLKSLTLTNNHHRYITKAFMGLENLEILDLSNNDIIALIKAFSYIPNLKVLDLSGNELRSVKVASDAASYLKNLQNLSLSDNYHIRRLTKKDLTSLKKCNIKVFNLFNTTINYVERGAFNYLPNLEFLELSVNFMNENALANVTCGISETIEIGYFRYMLEIKSFPYEAVYCLMNTKIRKLYLSNNYIKIVPDLPNLPSLRFLDLSNCSLGSIEPNAFQNVTNIEFLDLTGNKFAFFPLAISSVKTLKTLIFHNQNTKLYQFIIPDYAFQNFDNLQTFRLSFLQLNSISRYQLYGLRNLEFLSLSSDQLNNIENYAFETLTSLKLLDLRGNGLSHLSNFTFFGLKSLKHLYLKSNSIKFYPSIYPFQFSPSLSVIFMQVNLITSIPQGMFSNLKKLEILSLGRNKITPWTKTILNPNASLKALQFSENIIDYVSDIMLQEFHQVTQYLDLQKNPFNCSKCGMKEFQTFCKNTNISLTLPLAGSSNSNYVCALPESLQNKNFFDTELPENTCHNLKPEVISLLAIILMCLFLLVAILASFLCYNFRWYVRYWIFHFKTGFGHKKDSFSEKNHIYDAFIIYSSVDAPWIVSHLIPALEEQDPFYKLCIHERDFQVGKQITENILESIENSRKVILILSENFIQSEWCMYELHLAQHKLFRDSRDILILVKLKTIDKKLYTKDLSYIEKTRRCFMWTDSHMGQKLFWERMRKQLGQPRTSQYLQTVAL